MNLFVPGQLITEAYVIETTFIFSRLFLNCYLVMFTQNWLYPNLSHNVFQHLIICSLRSEQNTRPGSTLVRDRLLNGG